MKITRMMQLSQVPQQPSQPRRLPPQRDAKEKECEDDDIDTGDDDGDGVDQWWRVFDEIASNHNVTLNNIFPDGLGVIVVQGVQQMMKFCTQCHVWVHGLVSAHIDTEGHQDKTCTQWSTLEGIEQAILHGFVLQHFRAFDEVGASGWSLKRIKSSSETLWGTSCDELAAQVRCILEEEAGGDDDGDVCATRGCNLAKNPDLGTDYKYCCRMCEAGRGHGKMCTKHDDNDEATRTSSSLRQALTSRPPPAMASRAAKKRSRPQQPSSPPPMHLLKKTRSKDRQTPPPDSEASVAETSGHTESFRSVKRTWAPPAASSATWEEETTTRRSWWSSDW